MGEGPEPAERGDQRPRSAPRSRDRTPHRRRPRPVGPRPRGGLSPEHGRPDLGGTDGVEDGRGNEVTALTTADGATDGGATVAKPPVIFTTTSTTTMSRMRMTNTQVTRAMGSAVPDPRARAVGTGEAAPGLRA